MHSGVHAKAMAAVGKDYLACNHARRNGIYTRKGGIRRDRLEALILDGLSAS